MPPGIRIVVPLGRKPNAKEGAMIQLPIANLATIACESLIRCGGFTLDRFGNPPEDKLTPWVVAIQGRQQEFPGIPSEENIASYLVRNGWPFSAGVYFGGWNDNGICFLDHSAAYQHLHTAVQEGKLNKQKAIYNLNTGEVLELDSVPGYIPESLESTPKEGRAKRFGVIAEKWARDEPAAIDALCDLLPEWAQAMGLR